MINPAPWAHRVHPGPRTAPLRLSAEHRAQFEDAIRPGKAEKRVVLRAQAVLLMAECVPAIDISTVLGVNVRTVEKWRDRFDCENPVERLADAPRSGRPPALSRLLTAHE